MFTLQKKKCHLGNLKISKSELTFQNFGNLSLRINDDIFTIKPSGVNLSKVNYKDYPIISLTLTECQIDNFTADLAINQKAFFTYILNFNDTISEIPARGKIIGIDGQKLTINLFKPQPYFLNELKKFVEEFSKKNVRSHY